MAELTAAWLTRSSSARPGLEYVDEAFSFSGELGYEIYCAPHYQLALYEALEREGADLGLRAYGGRALMSMRLEKNWGVWTTDFRPDFTAAESGLDVYVAFDKQANFIGKAAAQAEREQGPDKKLVTLMVDTEDLDCVADEPIFHDGICVGYVTSGGFGHTVGKSLAMGYVPAALTAEGTKLRRPGAERLRQRCFGNRLRPDPHWRAQMDGRGSGANHVRAQSLTGVSRHCFQMPDNIVDRKPAHAAPQRQNYSLKEDY
ncbi:glycine cleavage T C-terminal barrel domain-containing protein [Mesorhizobium kowhaii]|nr:glycine cleavage T C-terminal barrel domain-containing protein [Mesorhizobium kowhaii]